jgi:site-specific DNA recombinase
MPDSTDQPVLKRAVLYCRVSGEEQRKKGFSLADQLHALRDWCSENGYQVSREVEDAGYSGAYLERPGLDQVREMVAAGEVEAVVVLFRDRIARGVYAQLLVEEFRHHGARLIALNSRGDDSPDGELGDNILDVIAAWERKKIAERMNRGKRRKAREGKLVACPQSDYGFSYNETRDGYEVDPSRMALIRRIFRMVGVEGMTLNAVARQFEAEGIPSPRGKRFWNRPGLRKLIMSDVYLAHTYEELASIVTPEVASRLDPEKRYGISWYGKQRHTHTQVVRFKNGKKIYSKSKKSVEAPREEWIGIPVPDSGIPREWVLAAREAIKDNQKISNCGRRFWELTGGVLRCAGCGYAMGTNFIIDRGTGYYRCGRRYRLGVDACSQSKTLRAVETEALVWGFVSGVLKDPTRLELGLNRMIEQEKALGSRGSGDYSKAWLKKLSELEVQEERLLDLYLEGKLEMDRYEKRLTQIKLSRSAVEEELAHIAGRAARVDQLERDRDTLINNYSRIVPDQLDVLEPAERNRIYKMLDLTVLAHEEGSLELKWAPGAGPCVDSGPLPPGNYRTRDS